MPHTHRLCFMDRIIDHMVLSVLNVNLRFAGSVGAHTGDAYTGFDEEAKCGRDISMSSEFVLLIHTVC